MVGFSRLQVNGYRRLRNLDLNLGPLNVLIGANGVGKSSVLEVELISASAAGGLQSALSTAGGFYSLLTADDQTHMLRFGLQWPDPPGSPIDYELAIASGGILGGTQIS